MITPEQIAEIKKQIINQIDLTFPEEKKEESIAKINAMNDSEIMEFLETNNLIKDPEKSSESSNCVFCSIAHGKITSIKIKEDENSVAVLEINPLSEGHTIIIPKEHAEMILPETESFAGEIKEQIKNSLNPKEIISEHSELFGHKIINIIPVYGESIEKDRKKIPHTELEKTRDKILLANEDKELKKENNGEIEIPKIKEIDWKKIKLPRRIP